MDRADIKRARIKDRQAKLVQKWYKDARANVKLHTIKEGDQVLLERRSSKQTSPYRPDAFKVTEVHGTQITAKRGEEIKIRDSQKFKKVQIQ